MKREVFFLVPGIFFLAAACLLRGEEWTIVGARSLGMGGTGVASARGAAAYYWNPALFARENHADLCLPVGLGVAVEGDMLEKADYLGKRIQAIDLDALQDKFNNDPTSLSDDDFRNAFEILLVDIPPLAGEGTGVVSHGTVGTSVRFGDYGVTVLGIGYGGAHPFIDLSVDGGVALSDDDIQLGIQFSSVTYGDHTAELSPAGIQVANTIAGKYALSTETATTFVWLAETTRNPDGAGVDFTDPTTRNIFYAVADATFGNDSASGTYEVMVNNLSGVDLGLVAVREAGFTVSRAVMDGRLAVGVNLKGVIADTFVTSVVVSRLEDGQSIADQVTEFKMSGVSSSRLGLDAGMVYALTDFFQVGLTVRNLNSPTFRFEGEDDGFTLYSQARAGILWKPLASLSVAADMDVMPNLSDVIKGLKVQFLAGGVEWQPVGWFALRSGMYKNIAVGESPVYTLGLGLKVWRCYLDVAGAMGFSNVKVESDLTGDAVYLPERGSFMFTLGIDLDF